MKKYFRSPHTPVLLAALALLAVGLGAGLRHSGDVTRAQAAVGDTLNIVSKRYNLENPDIAMNKKGDAVIVWQEKRGQSYDVFAVKTHSDRDFLDSPFVVNTYTQNDQKRPQVAIDDWGNFTVVWESFGEDGNGSGIFGQSFGSDKRKWGVEFAVNTTHKHNQMAPDIAMNGAGDFAVSWESETDSPGREKRIFLRLFNESTGPVSEEIKADSVPIPQKTQPGDTRKLPGKANTAENALLKNARVAIGNDKKTMVVWQAFEKNDWNVVGQIFEEKGAPVKTANFLISNDSKEEQVNPTVSVFTDNLFAVAWETNAKWQEQKVLEPLTKHSVETQFFKNSGEKIFSQVRIAEPTLGQQDMPEVIGTTAGAFVVWQGKKTWTDKNAPRGQEKKNAWVMNARSIDVSGIPGKEIMELTSDNNLPYLEVRAAASGAERVGVVWKSKHPSKKRAMINFKQFAFGPGLTATGATVPAATPN